MVSGLEEQRNDPEDFLTKTLSKKTKVGQGEEDAGGGGEGGGGRGALTCDDVHGGSKSGGRRGWGEEKREIDGGGGKRKKKKAKKEGGEVRGFPPHLASYYRNAPVKRLKHPLEENIFSSLFITLVAVAVAIVIGVPVLLLVGAALLVCLALRYLSVIFVDCCSYVRFICSNRSIPNRLPPRRTFASSTSESLALANDVRWLGKKGSDKCESVLHTVLIFEGSMDLISLRHLVQSRVLGAETPEGELSYPRLVQKIVPLVGGYRWELDVQFDIQNHIFHGPSHVRTESQVQQYMSFLLLESLPMGKPLWEIRVLPNYGTQKDTLAILRVHQCLADGMTLVRILSHSLADHQQLHIPQRPHFAGLSFGFNVLRSFIVGPLTLFLWLFATFKDKNLFKKPCPPSQASAKGRHHTKSSASPQGKVKNRTRANNVDCNPTVSPKKGNSGYKNQTNVGREPVGEGLTVGGRTAEQGSETGKGSSGGGDCGVWKVLWSASMTMPKVARVKQIMRSSFNDVMLSAAAGSIRAYFQKQGIPYPGDVKVVIPVDLRNDIASPKSSTKLGCKVALVLATVPSGLEAAIPRLWSTRHRLDELKASADPVVVYGTTAVIMNILPHSLGVSVLESMTNKASFQFCNLPGPTSTLVVGGYPLKGVYPIYPPSGEIRVSISIFTYADQVHVTVVAHKSLTDACSSLLHGMNAQVDQLSRQLSQRRVPGESRRSARHMSTNNSEITKPPTKQIHIKLQVVQEELQQLSNRLDWVEGQSESVSSLTENLTAPATVSHITSQGDHTELRSRLKTLQNEFSELIGELRRRSSIVEGVTISFEDEEMEEEFRKPRKRALSVVSVTRRSSIFSANKQSLTTPESSQVYSSEEDVSNSAITPPPSSGGGAMGDNNATRIYSPGSAFRHNPSQSIRTTAV